MPTKRLLVISDLHCGSSVGLTPPRWQTKSPTDGDSTTTKDAKYAQIQRACWTYFHDQINKLKPFDCVIVNGDAIDGRGERSGGTELLTVDRMEQCEIARFAIRQALTKDSSLIMTYGTAYHTGDEEDWEGMIAKDLNALKIGAHEWIDVNGTIFDFKHHLGSSSVPYGRHTAVAKEAIWNLMWAERGLQPKADVIVRSHVHYYTHAGVSNKHYFTTPALQAMGTKYGSRRCSGLVDWGFMVFEVGPKGEVSWETYLINHSSEVASAIEI